MKRWAATAVCCAATLLAATGSGADERSLYKSAAPILSDKGAAGWTGVELGWEILSARAAGEADLRLFDSDGNEIPYHVRKAIVPAQRESSRPLEIVSYEKGADRSIVDLWVPDSVEVHRGVALAVKQKNFYHRVEASAGEDFDSLQPLASDSIFDFSADVPLRRDRIEYADSNARAIRLIIVPDRIDRSDAPSMELHYRGLDLRMEGKLNQRPLRIQGFRLFSGRASDAQPVYDRRTLVPLASEMDEEGDQTVDFGPIGHPIDRISLEASNAAYYRSAEILHSATGEEGSWRRIGSGDFYRLPGMSGPNDGIEIPERRFGRLRIRIHNRDNRPLEIRSAEARWVRRTLYFLREPGEKYSLYAGRANAAKPQYDSEALWDRRPPNPTPPSLPLGPVAANPRYDSSAESIDGPTLWDRLWTPLMILLVAGLTLWAWSLKKRLPTE